MKKETLQFLAALADAPSPSGYEGPARRVWCDALAGVADAVEVDVHGNAIATINPGGSPHVMLAGHIDELGFQICHIEESGILRFRTIGGHDLRSLSGRRVPVHSQGGPVFGVIGQRPVHLVRERNRAAPPPQAHDLWIDCGFAGRKEAIKSVEIGDPATYLEGFQLVRNQLAVARGFDNRVGAFVVAETLRALARAKTLRARVSAVATVQEEIGLRGAKTSAFGLDPDAGIAVDVTWATDNPGGEAKEIGEVKLGAGPVLVRGPNVNPPLHRLLKSTASKLKIALQPRSIPGASGTDANPLQLTRAGVATALVSIPNRYMHSPVEMCHLGDVEAAVKLLAGTIKALGPKTSFIPD
jgi:endoglucanase